MLFGFFILLLCQLAGEVLARTLHLPIPGPVLGMAMLFVALLLFPGLHPRVQQTSHGLLNTMSLFFIPAGVGAMTVWGTMRDNAASFFAVVVVSTLLAGWAAAATFALMNRHRVGRRS